MEEVKVHNLRDAIELDVELEKTKAELNAMRKAFLQHLQQNEKGKREKDGSSKEGEDDHEFEVLEYHPSDVITFKGPFIEANYAPLLLRNTSPDQIVCYKIKVTHPSQFLVRPWQDNLLPGETGLTVIELLPLDHSKQEQIKKCKFLIQYAAVSSDESKSEKFNKEQEKIFWEEVQHENLKFKKLPVVLQDIAGQL